MGRTNSCLLETEIGVTPPQGKEHLESPGTEEAGKAPLLAPSGVLRPCSHLDFVHLATRTERINYCCFKPLS